MQAVERLESRLRSRPSAADGAADSEAHNLERDRLAGELSEARERERALESAAAEASAALAVRPSRSAPHRRRRGGLSPWPPSTSK
jgi:hypothetical protein